MTHLAATKVMKTQQASDPRELLIVIHTSDSSFGNAIQINEWHKNRKFKQIGYHFVILNGYPYANRPFIMTDGFIETGRVWDDVANIAKDEIGAHALGFNCHSIGICLIGDATIPTPLQMNSLCLLILNLLKSWPKVRIIGHCEIEPNKTCPGFDVRQVITPHFPALIKTGKVVFGIEDH